jgi:predicted enzyme related to lactoylglutathione lyase
MKLKAKLIHVSVPAFQKQKQHDFWSKLFGIDVARSLTDTVDSHHIPISQDGLFLTIGAPQSRRDSHITCFFAVENMNQTIAELKAAGGKVIQQPFEIPVAKRANAFYDGRLKAANSSAKAPNGEFASVAYLEDPDGNMIGLMEVHESAHVFFGLGKFQKPLSSEQVSGHQATVEAGKRFDQDRKAAL